MAALPGAGAAPKDRIIVAVDLSDKRKIRKLFRALAGHVGFFKVGYECILAVGVDWIARVAKEYSVGVFADVKLDDIPNTVGKATAVLARKGFAAVNVHASAGIESLKAAVANKGDMLVFVVTVLTSINDDECISIFGERSGQKVQKFALMALEAGADGIICSPQEGKQLRTVPELSEMLIWTPGIRSADAPPDDQRRTLPAGTAAMFADGLVIGRPIVDAKGQAAAANAFAAEIAATEAALAKDARCVDYELEYSYPHEFDDDSGSGIGDHEICWGHDGVYGIRAENDKEARQLADEFLKGGTVTLGRETAHRKERALKRVI